MSRIVAYYTDTEAYGGAERALLDLIGGLDRDRWTPLLLYHDSHGVAPLVQQARELNVVLHPILPMPLGLKGAARAPQLSGFLRRVRPAVFHAHLTWPLACKYGLVAATLANVPAVVATAHLFVDLPYGTSARLQQRLIAGRLGCYIAVSRHVASRVRLAFSIPSDRMRVVHNAVSRRSFLAQPDPSIRALLDGGTGGPVVLTCSRLDPQKGLEYLLRAAALLPRVAFAIAGDGPLRETLEAESRRLGVHDRVNFLGQRDDVARLLANCDLFLLPSLFEGLPLSILEAMAAGKPVIATAIGGTDEIITDGANGLLVPPRDPEAIARAVERLLLDEAARTRLASAGYARVAHDFSAAKMVENVTAIYDELIERRSRRAAA